MVGKLAGVRFAGAESENVGGAVRRGREVLIKRSGNRAGPIRPICKGYTHVLRIHTHKCVYMYTWIHICKGYTSYAHTFMCTQN